MYKDLCFQSNCKFVTNFGYPVFVRCVLVEVVQVIHALVDGFISVKKQIYRFFFFFFFFFLAFSFGLVILEFFFFLSLPGGNFVCHAYF